MSCTALTWCCPRVVPVATLPSPTHKPQLIRLSCLNVLMSWHSKDSKTMLLAIAPLKRICWQTRCMMDISWRCLRAYLHLEQEVKYPMSLALLQTGTSSWKTWHCRRYQKAPYTLETCASDQWNTLRCGLLQPDDLFSKEIAFSSPPSKRSANPYSDSWTFSTLVYRLQMNKIQLPVQ